MDEWVEITDQESAEAWLETQDDQTQVWFAVRCALRGLPALGEWPKSTSSGLAIIGFRAVLQTATGVPFPIANIDEQYRAAGNDSAHSANISVWAANLAAKALIEGPKSAANNICASVLVNSLDAIEVYHRDFGYSAVFAHSAAYEAATRDANGPLNPLKWGPLWPEGSQPQGLKKSWKDLKAQWQADDADWDFWLDWYEKILNGEMTDQDWELTRRIALEVTDEEWDAGQAVVAKRINSIQEKLVAEQAETQSAARPEPTASQKAAVAERVTQNRDAIALSVASLLEQLAAYRERVRGLNGLEPEYREDLLQFIDDTTAKLTELFELLPEKPEPIAPERGGQFIQWVREYTLLVPGIAKRYAEPKNVAEATVPTAIILAGSAVGAMIGGPVGSMAGIAAAGLITNNMKPGQAAKALLEKPNDAGEAQP